MYKFVIWGAGYRGKIIYKILGSEKVEAFIDSSKDKIGIKYCGKDVIDIETYKNKYSEYFIIISIDKHIDIEKILLDNGIEQYFNLTECPSEIQGFGVENIFDKVTFNYSENETNIIYGINLFSLLLYEKFLEKNVKKLFIVPDSFFRKQLISSLINKGVKILNSFDEINTGVIFNTTTLPIRPKNSNITVEESFDFSDRIKEYYNSELLKYKNSCSGRCFIVATGPSLRDEDLEKLFDNNEKCFSMNKIFFYKGRWRPDYYVFADRKGIIQYKKEIIDYKVREKFIADINEGFWEDVHEDNINRIHVMRSGEYKKLPDFSEKIEQKVFAEHTVTYVCIQLAVYMGFKEIILTGADCSYLEESHQNYFFSAEYPDKVLHDTEGMFLTFFAAKKYADEHGIKIFNATRGGKLEVFERVDFDNLFQ